MKERLLELARNGAREQHEEVFAMEDDFDERDVASGHTRLFDSCQHPDCVLVRGGSVPAPVTCGLATDHRKFKLTVRDALLIFGCHIESCATRQGLPCNCDFGIACAEYAMPNPHENRVYELEAHTAALLLQLTALRDQWREHAQHLKLSPEYRLSVSATIAGVGWLLECANELDTVLSGSAETKTP